MNKIEQICCRIRFFWLSAMADLIEEWSIHILIEIDTDKENAEEDSILAKPCEKYPWMYWMLKIFLIRAVAELSWREMYFWVKKAYPEDLIDFDVKDSE